MFGFGLPPAAPMSPPAALTRIEIGPELRLRRRCAISKTRGFVGDVPEHGAGAGAMALEIGLRRRHVRKLPVLGGCAVAPIVNGDVGAELRKPCRHGVAEAAAGPGNERYLSLQREPYVCHSVRSRFLVLGCSFFVVFVIRSRFVVLAFHLQPAHGAHILHAPIDLRHFECDDFGPRRAALPRRPVVGSRPEPMCASVRGPRRAP